MTFKYLKGMEVIHKLNAFNPPDWKECMPRLLLVQISELETMGKELLGSRITVDIVGRTTPLITPPLKIKDNSCKIEKNNRGLSDDLGRGKGFYELQETPTSDSSFFFENNSKDNKTFNQSPLENYNENIGTEEKISGSAEDSNTYTYEINWFGGGFDIYEPPKNIVIKNMPPQMVGCTKKGKNTSISYKKNNTDDKKDYPLETVLAKKDYDEENKQEHVVTKGENDKKFREDDKCVEPTLNNRIPECDDELFGAYTDMFTRSRTNDVIMKAKIYYWHDFTEIGVFRITISRPFAVNKENKVEQYESILGEQERKTKEERNSLNSLSYQETDVNNGTNPLEHKISPSTKSEIVIRIPLKKITAAPYQEYINLDDIGKVLVEAISLPWDHPNVVNDTLLNDEKSVGGTSRRAIKICPLFKRFNTFSPATVNYGKIEKDQKALSLPLENNFPAQMLPKGYKPIFNYEIGQEFTSRTAFESYLDTFKGLSKLTIEAIRGAKVMDTFHEMVHKVADSKVNEGNQRGKNISNKEKKEITIILYNPNNIKQIAITSCIIASHHPQADDTTAKCSLYGDSADETSNSSSDTDMIHEKVGFSDDSDQQSKEEKLCSEDEEKYEVTETSKNKEMVVERDTDHISFSYNNSSTKEQVRSKCYDDIDKGDIYLFPVSRCVISLKMIEILVLTIRVMYFSLFVHKYGKDAQIPVDTTKKGLGQHSTSYEMFNNWLSIKLVLLMNNTENDFVIQPFISSNFSISLKEVDNKLFDFSQSDTIDFSSSRYTKNNNYGMYTNNKHDIYCEIDNADTLERVKERRLEKEGGNKFEKVVNGSDNKNDKDCYKKKERCNIYDDEDRGKLYGENIHEEKFAGRNFNLIKIIRDNRTISCINYGDIILNFFENEDHKNNVLENQDVSKSYNTDEDPLMSANEYNSIYSKFVDLYTSLLDGIRSVLKTSNTFSLPSIPCVYVIPTDYTRPSGLVDISSRASELYKNLFTNIVWKKYTDKILIHNERYKMNIAGYLEKMNKLIPYIAGPVRAYIEQEKPKVANLGSCIVTINLCDDIVKVNCISSCNIVSSSKTKAKLFKSKVFVQVDGNRSPHLKPIKFQKYTKLIPSRIMNFCGVADNEPERTNEWLIHYIIFSHHVKYPEYDCRTEDKIISAERIPANNINDDDKDNTDNFDIIQFNKLAVKYLYQRTEDDHFLPSTILGFDKRTHIYNLLNKGELKLEEAKVKSTEKSLNLKGYNLTKYFDVIIDGIRFVGAKDVSITSRAFAPSLSVALFDLE